MPTTETTMFSSKYLLTALIAARSLSALPLVQAQDDSVVVADYGVDCTFPIHSKHLNCRHEFADDRKKFYEDFMQGCRDHYGSKGKRCDSIEADRIKMSIRQPQSMVNYTSTGFKKLRAPERTMDMLLGHWNRNRDKKKQEVWGVGNVYV